MRAQAVTTRNATFQLLADAARQPHQAQSCRKMIVQGVRPITLALGLRCARVRAVLVTRAATEIAVGDGCAIATADCRGRGVVPGRTRAHAGARREGRRRSRAAPSSSPSRPMTCPGCRSPPRGSYVALDRPASPGNIGTVVRTVDALGGHGVIVTGRRGSWVKKALRASTGSALMTTPSEWPGAAVLDWIAATRTDGVSIRSSRTSREKPARTTWDVGLACRPRSSAASSSEHSRMSAAWKDACVAASRAVPMTGHASSLNAAQATAVLLCEALRQRQVFQRNHER